MKKKLLGLMALSICVMFVLSGCLPGSGGVTPTTAPSAIPTVAPTVVPTDVPTIVPTDVPTPIPTPTITASPVKLLSGGLVYVPSGTKYDFDKDGVIETLTYSSPNNFSMKLTIKDAGIPSSKSVKWNLDCDNPSKKVYLGDLTSKDGVLDLFVDEFGPSDDNSIHVAAVKPSMFSTRGTVPGWISDFKLLGNGVVSTQKRMDILMTWYAAVQYKLNASGKLVFAPQKLYSMNNFKCKTKVALPLLKTSNIDLQETAFLIPVGKTIYLQTTDDKKWISIKYGSKTGWLLMADLYTILDPYAPATDIIDGLVIAD
ncbi:MAG: hypothetical protein WCQ41_08840 [Bacillota bacterium]